MARRKRLTPANPDYLAPSEDAPGLSPLGPAPETLRGAPISQVAGDSSAQAALAELSRSMEEARDQGRMVLSLPHGAIRLDYLVRDRLVIDDAEMTALTASLRARGQQTPVEVTKLDDGSYGLISGWRRCKALARLHAETGEDRFARVLALVRKPADAPAAYLAMVEENEIRANLSYYERARIVFKAVARGVFASEQEALRTLFASASRAKRSKIGSFMRLVEGLDGTLRFPEALPERAGLALVKVLDADPEAAQRLRADLAASPPGDAEEELARLATLSEPKKPSLTRDKTPDPTPKRSVQEIRPGLHLRQAKDGSLTLSGPALTEDLRAALTDWLRAQGSSEPCDHEGL